MCRAVFPALTVAVGIALCGVALAPAAVPRSAAAQGADLANIVPEDAAVTIHARITAVDPATRHLTLTGRSGTPVTLAVGPAVRLEMLKPGDTVDVQYLRSVAFTVSSPGQPVPEDEMSAAMARPVMAPGGIGMKSTRVNGLVVGIDIGANTVDLVNPQGGAVYTVKVTDPSRQAKLPLLKVGDIITALITEAVAVSVTPARRSWF